MKYFSCLYTDLIIFILSGYKGGCFEAIVIIFPNLRGTLNNIVFGIDIPRIPRAHKMCFSRYRAGK